MNAGLSAIYLSPRRRRAGHGRALLATGLDARRAHGATGLLTWVIAGNRGARRFHQRLGGELPVEQPFERDGMDLVKAGYGWRDLPALAGAVASNS